VSEPNPHAPDHLPDHVLEELLDAFAEEAVPNYDFDDPGIDQLLGITDEHGVRPEDEIGDDEIDEIDDDENDEIDDDENDDEIGDDEIDDDDEVGDEERLVVSALTPSVNEGQRKIIVIAEDDRPDSVYLDEDKEKAFNERRDAVDDSGERSTIVIADLDEHGGGGEPPVARSRSERIDPRIRARRISVRRAESRRRLVWLSIGAAVVLVAVAAIAIVASPIFDVRTITVQGAAYTDSDVLDSIIDKLAGEPVLLVDTEAIEQQLEGVAWVESARVRTDFPHSVFIDIRERRPVLSFRGSDERFRVIDEQGRVLDVIDGQPADFLLLEGLHPNTARGQFAGAVYASVAELVVALPDEIGAITRSVGADPVTGTLTLFLGGDGIASGGDSVLGARLGNPDDLDQKLARLLLQVRDGLDGVCGLDVSTSVAGVVRC